MNQVLLKVTFETQSQYDFNKQQLNMPSLVVLMFTVSWFICFSWLRSWLDGRRVTCPWFHMTMHCQPWVSDVGNMEIASLIRTLGCFSYRYIVQTADILAQTCSSTHAETQMSLWQILKHTSH